MVLSPGFSVLTKRLAGKGISEVTC